MVWKVKLKKEKSLSVLDKCESILKNDNKNNNHVGIRNVNDRIQICFGKEYGVTIISEVDKGTKIKIRLPLKKDNNI